MRFFFFAQTILLVFLVTQGFAETLDSTFLSDAVSDDNRRSANAVKTLRAKGQKGLDQLTAHFASEISQYRIGKTPNKWKSISKALDRVAAQKDAYSSGLFWYRDLENARKVASSEGKAVLSLRLLGNLDEEYSCANSRFFRSILYTDPEIQKLLREKYVLHWSSERPAPKISIDFGDGRKLVRTITGNSIHYVIRPDGEVVDALPGLYSPKDFRRNLRNIARRANAKAFAPGRYRASVLTTLMRDFRIRSQGSTPSIKKVERNTDKPVVAIDAAPLAVTKMVTEIPTLFAMERRIKELTENTSVSEWDSIAESVEVSFSQNALLFMKRKSGNLSEAGFSSMLDRLKKTVATDTVQNEHKLRPQILQHMGNKRVKNLEELNAWIYKEVFLTGKDDKWLGLYESDIYYGVENNGRQ